VTLRVLVADDSPAVRAALRDVLALSGHSVVAEVSTGADAVVAARESRPDVVVVDVDMPGGGPDLVRVLASLDAVPRVMAHSAYDDARTVVDVLAAGATAYVVIGLAGGDLESCVRRCAEGVLFVVAGCADHVRERLVGS
jgi:DNA-binding NarL/FixJ family response regulator